MTLDNETDMDLLKTLGVLWTLFSPGSHRGKTFTTEELVGLRAARGFKSLVEAHLFIQWAIRHELVFETDRGFRFTDEVRDVYWFYIDVEEIPPEDTKLSPAARAKADAIAERVRRKHWPQVQVSSDPTPAQYKILNSHATVAHGATPAIISIPAGGPYTIQVETAGYKPWSVQIVLRPDERRSINAVLERVLTKVVAPPKPKEDQPDPRYRYGLKGFSKDIRNCVIIVRFMHDRWGTQKVHKDVLFKALADAFNWQLNVGVPMGRMLYGMGRYIQRTGGLWSDDPVFYEVRPRGVDLLKRYEEE